MPEIDEPARKRFRIGISFSGDIRDLVQSVATNLADAFGANAILYDKFHEAEFARGDLAIYLPKLYREDCDLIVAIFDPSYLEKEWTGLEWHAIYALHKSRQYLRVMLLSIGTVRPDELHGLDGTSNVKDRTPHEITSLILERLAINEGRDRTHYYSLGIFPKAENTQIPRHTSTVVGAIDALRDELYFVRRERNGRSRRRTLLSLVRRANALPVSNAQCAEFRIYVWKQALLEARHYSEYEDAVDGLRRAFEEALSAPIPKAERWAVVRAVCEAAVDISQMAPGAVELNKIASHLSLSIKHLGILLGLNPEADHSQERLAELLATRAKCKRALATVLSRRTHATHDVSARVKALRQEALQDATRSAQVLENGFTLLERALALFANASSPNSDNAKNAFDILSALAKETRNTLASYEYIRQLKIRHRYLEVIEQFYALHEFEFDRRRLDANLTYFATSIIGLHYQGTDPERVKSASVDAVNWLQEAISAEHHRARDIVDYCYMLAIAGYPIESFTAPLQEINQGGKVAWSVIGQMSYHAASGERTLREALLLGLEDANVWSRMGTLHFDFAKDNELAIICHDQAIHIDPRSPVYHFNKARVLAYGLRNYASARYSLSQARRLAKNMWGWFKVNENDFDELERVITTQESKPQS